MQLKHLSYYKPCLLKLPIPRTLAYVKLAWSQLLAWRMDHSKLYQDLKKQTSLDLANNNQWVADHNLLNNKILK